MATPFEITKDEVLDLAANKLAAEFGDSSEIYDRAATLLRKEVENLVATTLKARVDATLATELEKILGQEIAAVNIWGEREGKPTTLRACLAERAKVFWEMKVEKDGRESSYGGEPRYKQLMREILHGEFKKAVESNAAVIVAEFKKALLTDATRIVTENINRLIK